VVAHAHVVGEQAEHLAVLDEGVDVGGQERPQVLVGLHRGRGRDLVDAVQQRADQAGDQVVLGFEMVIEAALGDTQAFGDLAQRRPVVALLAEQLQRAGENLLSPRGPSSLDRLLARHSPPSSTRRAIVSPAPRPPYLRTVQ
jgi:hypothetical protein